MHDVIEDMSLIDVSHTNSIISKYKIFDVDLLSISDSEKKFTQYMFANPIDIETTVNIFHPLGDILFDVKIKMPDKKISCKPYIKLDYFYDIDIFIDNVKIQYINQKIIKICEIAIADYKKNYFKHAISSAETSLQTKLEFI